MARHDINAPVVDSVRKILRDRGLKHGYIAEKAGFTRHEFSAMLCGYKTMRPLTVLKIAQAIGVSLDEIFGIPPNKSVEGNSA